MCGSDIVGGPTWRDGAPDTSSLAPEEHTEETYARGPSGTENIHSTTWGLDAPDSGSAAVSRLARL